MDPLYVDPITGRPASGPPPGLLGYDPQTQRPFMDGTPLPAAPAAAAPNQNNNWFMGGLKSGFDTTVSDVGGFAAALGNVMGSQGLQDFGQDLSQRYGDYAKQAGRQDLEENPWSLPGFGYQLAKAVPSMAGLIGASMASGGLGSVLGIGRAAAAFGGATLAGTPLMSGGLFNTAMEQEGGAKDGEAARALALGIPLAALGAYAPARIDQIFANKLEGKILTRMAAGSMAAAPMAAVNAGANTAVDQTFRDNPGSTLQRAREIVGSVVQGGVVGAAFGGAMGAIRAKPVKETTNEDLTNAVDQEVKPPAPPEPEPAPAAPEPPAPAVRTMADYPDDALQQMHAQLTQEAASTDDPKNMRLRQMIEAELNARLHPEDENGVRAPREQGPSPQPELPLGEPEQKFPASEAYEAQQQALADTQQGFLDDAVKANGGKASQWTKILEQNPVSTPEEFQKFVYDRFDSFPDSKGMKKLAGDLGLLDDDGKLYTPETIDAAITKATRTHFLEGNKAETEEGLKELEATKAFIDGVMAERVKSAEVPAFEEGPRQQREPPGLPTLADTEEPGLPLSVPHPMPLEGIDTPTDLFRAVTGNPTGYTASKAGTSEGRILDILNQKGELKPTNISELERVGLVEDGQRVPLETAIADQRKLLEAGQALNNPKMQGQVEAKLNQLLRLKTLSDANDARAALGDKLNKPSLQKAYAALEKVRRQVPAEMPNLMARIEDMQAKVIGNDAEGPTYMAGQASQLVSQAEGLFKLHRAGMTADASPMGKAEPGQPSQAAVERVEAIKAKQQPTPTTEASQTFTTAKGSTYTVHDDGTTTRTKAARSDPGHEGDSGLKPRTDKTVYLSPANAQRLAPPQGKWQMVDHGDGTMSLATPGKDGTWGISPSARNVPVSDKPTAGSTPLEMWKKGKLNGRDAYETVHFGNQITQLGDAKAAPPKTQAEAQARKGTARVKASELTPAVQADLEKAGYKVVSDPDLASVDYPQARTQIDTDLDHIVANGGRMQDALGHIAENSSDPIMRQFAAQMKRLGVDPEIRFASKDGVDFESRLANDPDTYVPASYNPGTDTVSVYDRSSMEHPLMHEAVHSATIPALDKGTSAAREMNRLFDIVKDKMGDAFYASSNVKEFVSEAISNPRTREFLRTQPVDTGSFVGNAWQAIKNTVFKLLRMPERMRSMFDQVMETSSRLMDESAVAKEGRVGSVIDTDRQTAALMQELPLIKEMLNHVVKTVEKKGMGSASAKAMARDVDNSFSAKTLVLERTPDLGTQREDFVRTTRDRGVHVNQLLQATNKTLKAVDKVFTGKAKPIIQRLTAYDELRIDPSKTWSQHTQLHEAKDAEALKGYVEQANQDLRTLKQVGGDAAVQAYLTMAKENAGMWYSRGGNAVRTFMSALNPQYNFPGLDQSAVDLRQHMEVNHDDVQAKHDYYKNDLTELLKAPQEYLKQKDAEASGLMALGGRENKKKAREIISADAGLRMAVGMGERVLTEGSQYPNFHKGHYGGQFASAHFAVDEDGNLANPQHVQKVRDMLDREGITGAFNSFSSTPTMFMRFESRDQAHAAYRVLQEAQAAGLLDKDKPVKYGDADNALNDSISKDVWNVIDKVMASQQFKIPEDASASEAEAAIKAQQELKQNIVNAYLEMVPDNAIQNVLRARKFTLGSSEDVPRNFANRNSITAHSIASLNAQPKINAAVGGMYNNLRQLQASGVSASRIDAANQAFRTVMHQENQMPRQATDNIIDTARAWTHAYFLAFSPAYVVMQLAQPIQTTLPELGKNFGFLEAGKAMTSVLPDVFKIMKVLIADPGRVDAVMTREKLLKAGVSKSILDAAMGMVNRGSIDMSSPTREIGKVAAGKADSWAHKLPALANTVPMWSEIMSRLIAGLAADKLHAANPEKAKMPGVSRGDFVDHVVRETMGRFGSNETPVALGSSGVMGKVTPLAGTFMNYYLQMFEKTTREMGKALGMHEGADRGAAARYLLGHTAVMGVLAGTMGLPFFNLLTGVGTKLANAFTGRDDFDLANGFRSFLSDVMSPEVASVVARGVPRALGVDLGNLGEADLFPFTKLLTDRRNFDDVMKDYGESLLGAPVGMASNLINGATMMYHGRVLDGMIQAMPTFARNPLTAYKIAQYGFLDSSGRHQPVEANSMDVVKQALGLHPSKSADVQEGTHTEKQLEVVRTNRAAIIRQNLMTALDRKDEGDLKTWLAEAQRFNLQHPATPIENIGQEFQTRKVDEGTAKSLGLPLGMSIKDQQTANQMRWMPQALRQ